jgi:hypothetical protein
MNRLTYGNLKDLHLGNKVLIARPDETPMVGKVMQKTMRVDDQFINLRILIEAPADKRGIIFVKTGDPAEVTLYHETSMADAIRKAEVKS